MLECKHCGNRNSDFSEYCFECGSPLKAVTGQVPAAIDGKYEILECLKSEEDRELYKVRDVRSNDVRVLRAFTPDQTLKALPGFKPEEAFRAAAGLKHPNLAEILDGGTLLNGKIYLVSEWVTGESVGAILKEVGPLPAAVAIRLIGEVLRGLHALHQKGFIHRALTPAKVMVFLTRHGAPRVKVVNPDVVTPINIGKGITPFDLLAGKGKYCSPEQQGGLPGGATLDGRSDAYSAALILYELISGQVPFSENTVYGMVYQQGASRMDPLAPSDLDPETTAEFNGIMLTALAKDRDQRFPNALAFEEALNHLDLPPLTAEVIQHYLGTLGSVRPSGAFSTLEPPSRPTPPTAYAQDAKTVMSTAVASGKVTPQPPQPPPPPGPPRVPPPTSATIVAPRAGRPPAKPELEATVMAPRKPGESAPPAKPLHATRIDDGSYDAPVRMDRTRIDHLETQSYDIPGHYEVLSAQAPPEPPVYHPPEPSGRPIFEGEADELGKGFTNVVGTIVQTAPPPEEPIQYEDETVQAAFPPPSAYSTIQAPPMRPVAAPPPQKGRGLLWLAIGAVVVVAAVVAALLFWPKTATGKLSLTVLPWGTVQTLENDKGGKVDIPTRETPLVVDLPVGTYKAQVKIAETDKVITVSFAIKDGQITTVTESDPGYSYEEFLRQIM